ncbi:leucine--tRNA ligase [Flavobacteriales bacterium]|nr:leucine--tRNA ligase [Flavobacteriales bacterium]
MSNYNPVEIEKKWQKYWADHKTFAAIDNSKKPKFYALDMFPYPSGAGLHVGHPLGYIASDVYSRYKRLCGYNVLHPMGYDSFGLPAEQYAIQTGQHPAVTTKTNIEGGIDKDGNKIPGYRNQLDKIGFSFDWDREIRTSDSNYYKWTQWIFKQIFNSWYNTEKNKAEKIEVLVEKFQIEGNQKIKAATDFEVTFSASEWKSWNEDQQQKVLLNYRLAYLSNTWVNWCPALGTVLANDEIKNGLSERGGHPVEQKLMRQWSMRITAYAERLLKDLDSVDWTDSIKEIQRNWIGKSVGAAVHFDVEGFDDKIEVFTTRPDTIYGVSFMVLAPEHKLVAKITTATQKNKIAAYQKAAALKSERDRMSDVKTISGEFTGAFASHPFTGENIPVWIGDYVLAGYGTGAVMAVPCGDQRDWDFAKHFNINIPNIFKDQDISKSAYAEKDVVITNSDFLNDLNIKKAIKTAIYEIEKKGFGKGKTQYKLRNAVFSRQRYWGEPFPVYYKGETPYLFEDNAVIELPDVDKYLPTEDGEPPLARAKKEAWSVSCPGDRMEYNTMPGWAGSSWYFLRYMDPTNDSEFVAKDKVNYWQNVDLYIGGAEHATGHLLYSRFWTKFLYDIDLIPFEEPFKKMINQGMIQGNSALVYRDNKTMQFISKNKKTNQKVSLIHVDINFLNGDKLNVEAFKKWRQEYNDASFIKEENGDFICVREVDKMSKSKFNVQNPDVLVNKFGADTLRCYEMFLGPLEQHKPWDVQGITGVNGFLKKVWRLFHDGEHFKVSNSQPTKEELKILHKTIKKIKEDIDRYSFNTPVSAFMICVNELTALKCNKIEILSELCIILSPYAPHISEELWSKLGNKESISYASFPKPNNDYLVESSHKYPISFNGKMKFLMELPIALSKNEIENQVLENEQTKKLLSGKEPKKIIVIPKKIVNIVI